MLGMSIGKFLLLVFLGVVIWSILRFRNAEVYDNLDGVLRVIEERLPPRS